MSRQESYLIFPSKLDLSTKKDPLLYLFPFFPPFLLCLNCVPPDFFVLLLFFAFFTDDFARFFALDPGFPFVFNLSALFSARKSFFILLSTCFTFPFPAPFPPFPLIVFDPPPLLATINTGGGSKTIRGKGGKGAGKGKVKHVDSRMKKDLRAEKRADKLKTKGKPGSKAKKREIGRAVQQECRDRSRMPSSA
eukprot:TRINITY_DN6072_c0_g1_i27.p1 TRINITY_DN6072_c0_g1~~TRINITY_DN6072_c0_g1_i27.p1  ORF type:complete len:206 (-),score=12.85 TRINITY_DN6072_c0_g1_i27:25-603(-)